MIIIKFQTFLIGLRMSTISDFIPSKCPSYLIKYSNNKEHKLEWYSKPRNFINTWSDTLRNCRRKLYHKLTIIPYYRPTNDGFRKRDNMRATHIVKSVAIGWKAVDGVNMNMDSGVNGQRARAACILTATAPARTVSWLSSCASRPSSSLTRPSHSKSLDVETPNYSQDQTILPFIRNWIFLSLGLQFLTSKMTIEKIKSWTIKYNIPLLQTVLVHKFLLR